MMKLWSRLCFLVLVISSISRGENGPAVTPAPAVLLTPPPTPPPSDETDIKAGRTTPSPPIPPGLTHTTNTTDLLSGNFTTEEEETSTEVNTTQEVEGTVAAQTTAWVNGSEGNVDTTTPVSTATAGTAAAAVEVTPEGTDSGSSWGYVILVLIILVIIALCAILYRLRRVSRTYSFDLNRQLPTNHHNEPIGTFEPVYLDDLERPAPKDQVITDNLSPPVSNGTTLQLEEPSSTGETDTSTPAPVEQPDVNGLETSPTSDISPSLGDDPADTAPSPMSSNLFFDAIGEEQQNENNNNPSVCSSDPFVEINLDEPAWCDQLLTSPEASSSVLPFSPFSFSSSSSSSS